MTRSHGDVAALEELEWLRNFAATLAGSGDDDDLVQDTLLAAWTHSPRASAEQPIRPWLAKVARNHSRMSARSRQRRARRERESSSGEPPSERFDPELELDRLDVLRAVFEALEELPELDRKIIVRRFLHEDNATQIGAQLGMPAATVRSRLSRSLARVRASVDARFEGSGKSWALALLGPVGVSPGKSAASSVGVTAKLGAAAKLGVTMAALGLVAGGWWSCRAEDRTDPAAAMASAGPDEAEAEPASTPAEAPPPSERQRWEQRRARARAALAKYEQAAPLAQEGREEDPSDAEDEGSAEATDDLERLARTRARAGLHDAVRACAEDLETDASGAITLTAILIGDPEVGTIFDSVDVVTETVGDPELLACLSESMYAYVGEKPSRPFKLRYTTTMPWIGADEDDTRKERRIFDSIVGAHHGEVAVCHQSDPQLEGTLVLEFVVGPAGTVEEPRIVSTDLPDAVVGCIAERSQIWRFPKDLADKMFRYQFRLPVVDLRSP